MTNIFVVNSGSSSIKYQLIDVETGEVSLHGLVDRIGEDGEVADHTAAMKVVLAAISTSSTTC